MSKTEIFPSNILNNKSLVEQIYEDIENKIIKGVIKPGQRIAATAFGGGYSCGVAMLTRLTP